MVAQGAEASGTSIVTSTRPDARHSSRAPLTFRGLALLMLGGYLALLPARTESDMVAAVIGYSLLGLVIILGSVTFLKAQSLKQSLSLSFTAESIHPGAIGPTAQTPTRMVIALSPVSLSPASFLILEIKFRSPLSTMRHVIVGRDSDRRLVIEDIFFPHRGDWIVSEVRFSVEDALGLSALRWSVGSSPSSDGSGLATVRVRPNQTPPRVLPLITSSVRGGDEVPDLTERLGEPFDLKAYHPSDGMRRILWKVFAKRGELIARHPERAVSPEGRVVVYVCANRLEDGVCADAVQFAEMIEVHDLELWAGCEGQGERPVARSSASLMNLLIDCVWDTRGTFGDNEASAVSSVPARSLSTSFERLSASVTSSSSGVQLSKVIIFTSHARLKTFAGSEEILALCRNLEAQGILPVLVLCRAGNSPDANSFLSAARGADSNGSAKLESDHAIYHRFVTACAQSGWEIITEHSG